MDLYLHLGAHRTGTTAFQAFLARNRAALAAAGWAIWLPADLRQGPLSGLAARPDGLAPAAEAALARHVDRALAALAAQGFGRLILSEENLLGTMAGCQAAAAPYPQAWARVRRLDALFGGRIRRAGLGLRDRAGWWASTYAFRVPRGGPLPVPADLDRITAQPRGFAELAAEIAEALPGRRVAVWDLAALADRPDRVLAALTGLPPPPGLRPARHGRNAAPTLAALAAMLRARGVGTLPPGLAAGLAPGLDPAAAARWMPFSPAQRAELDRRHAADLAWLGSDPPGIAFTGIAFTGSAGPEPGAGAWKEGPKHDRQDRSLEGRRGQGTA